MLVLDTDYILEVELVLGSPVCWKTLMLSLFGTLKTSSTEESRANASLEMPSFRVGSSDGTDIGRRLDQDLG